MKANSKLRSSKHLPDVTLSNLHYLDACVESIRKTPDPLLYIDLQSLENNFKFACHRQGHSHRAANLLCKLKALDTFGNCQRPVFSLNVSQHLKIFEIVGS